MIRVIGLTIALFALIYVRGSSADIITVWSGWWWIWIVVTCVIAGCNGWVAHDVYDKRRKHG
jgi:hypothetical protein